MPPGFMAKWLAGITQPYAIASFGIAMGNPHAENTKQVLLLERPGSEGHQDQTG